MLKPKLLESLNKQINAEFYSAYIYLSMAGYFFDQNLNGFGAWMKAQAAEELEHGMKIYGYLTERGAHVALKAIEEPPATWDSPAAAIEAALKHEMKMTASLNALMDQALAEKDHATSIFLQWFITEQVEEESQVTEILEKLKMLAKAPAGLLMLDHELGMRGAK